MTNKNYNVELTANLRLDIVSVAPSAADAIREAIKRFDSGSLDIIHALEHCTTDAVITDDLPKIGERCFNVNVLETRSRDFQVYADSTDEAENLVRNHLHTHVVLTADDLIGYDVLAE